MCILSSATPVVPSAPAPARLLAPAERQTLAVAALAGTQPITALADTYHVSRKFVYQQADQAASALTEAFAPPAPAEDILFHLPVTELWLQRLILGLLLISHSSYRGVQELLRDLFHCPRSLGYIHDLARAASNRARLHNQQHELSGVGVAAFDEIFQAGEPVLVGVDVPSTYCYLLSLEARRDGDTWSARLRELQQRGFAPPAVISDDGAGLQAGLARALPGVPCRADLFHVLQEVLPLVTALENQAYQALTTCAELECQQVAYERQHGRRDSCLSQQLRYARPAAEAAVALADDVATLVRWLQHDVLALAGPCYAERCALYDFIVAELRARRPQCPRRLRPLCTYLANQRDAVLAFAQQLDTDLEALAAAFQVSPAVVRAVVHVQRW